MKVKSSNIIGKLSAEQKLQNAIKELALQNELKQELEQTYKLAEIGTWDLDLQEQNLYWSSFIKILHEVPRNFNPDLDSALEFYKDEWSRKTIIEAIEDAIAHGTSFDLELIIITAKGNEKWVRALGRPVMHNGVCKRIYGSIQDITRRKNTELQLKKSNSSLTERVKEQDCLYRILNINEQELSIEELLSKAVKLIPSGFQFNEIATAEIIWKDQAFKTDNFGNSKNRLTESGDRFGKKALQVEVQYVDSSQLIEGLSFLKEEKQLLKAIINQLSQKIDQIIKRDEIKAAEENLIKSNRLYAFISAIDQMIVKTKDETSLFNQACSIAVDIGMFKMAWIGKIDETTKKVIPLVRAGKEDDYLTKMTPISIEDIPRGRGPTGTSLREGKYIVSNDIENDPQMAPWKEACIERGYLSCIALPVRKFGKVVGAYSLYAPVKNFFDDAEIALLERTADDISYALESLEKADRQKEAEEKLKDNYALSRMAGEIAKFGGWNINLEENRVYWSDKVAAIHEMPAGYTPSVDEGINFFVPEWRDKITEVFTNCAQKGISYDEDMEILTSSGKRIWVRTNGEAIRDHNGKIVKVQGAFQDITERKHTEKALQLTQFAFDNASDAIFWMSSDARIVNVNKAACVSLGYTQEELLSLSIPDIDPDFNFETWAGFFPELRKKHSISIETTHLRKDGSLLFVEIRTNYIKFGDKEFSCAFVRDVSERKAAEEKLLKSEHMLRESQRIANIGGWSWPLSGPMNWTDETYHIYCVSPETFTPTTESLVNLIHPEDRQLMQQWIEDCLAGKSMGDLEFRTILPDGSIRILSGRGELHNDAAGNPISMSGTVQDITERKQTETEVIKERDNAQLLFDIAGVMFTTLNKQGEIEKINKKGCEIFGYSNADELIGVNWFEVCLPKSKKNEVHAVFKQLMDGKVEPVEYYENPVLTKSGIERIIAFHNTIIFDSDSKITGILFSGDDITERKQAEEMLLRREKEFRALAESMPQIVWVTTADGKNIYFNHQWMEYTGLTLEQSYGDGWLIPFHEDDKPIAWKAWSNAVENQAEYSVECRLQKHDGTYYWWLVRGVPEFNEKGEILKWYGTCTNIEKIKQAELELVESLAEKETLLQELHHRVKNNLALVSGMMQLQAFEEENKNLKQKLDDSIGRIQTITSIHELLYQSESFSKLEVDKHIEKLVTKIVQSFQPNIEIDLHFDLQSISLNINQAIPFSLIINEVVTNVLKHAFDEQKEGTLSVILKEQENIISIQIVDNGKGLPPDFTKFESKNSLGMQLIETLSSQLESDYSYRTVDGETQFMLTFEKTEAKGTGNSLLS